MKGRTFKVKVLANWVFNGSIPGSQVASSCCGLTWSTERKLHLMTPPKPNSLTKAHHQVTSHQGQYFNTAILGDTSNRSIASCHPDISPHFLMFPWYICKETKNSTQLSNRKYFPSQNAPNTETQTSDILFRQVSLEERAERASDFFVLTGGPPPHR